MQLSATTLSRMRHILGRVDSESVIAQRLTELETLETELREALDGDISRWVDTIPGQARDAVDELYAAGGKRLRPVLALLCGGAGGGTPRQALPVAAAVELLHTGTLLHDDIVDEGEVRRGRPTARSVYGNALAVLAGDFCYFAALDGLVEHNDHEILRRSMQVARSLSEGELIQLQRRGTAQFDDEAEYFRIIDKKTASLVAFATWGGARCGGASPEQQQALDVFGRKLGQAFQIVDDVLDFSADPEIFGKALGQDVVEGTVTLPLICALERDPGLRHDVTALVAAFHASAEGEEYEADASPIIERVLASGGLDAAKVIAARVTTDALDALQPVPDSPYRRALSLLGASMLDRTT